MRRHYLDNIRWITVGLVVLYHVIFMYNGVVTAGVIGPFWEVQYQDAVQYLLYPWFMVLLFLVSGMCARYYLEGHSDREFLAGRTRKLLVPSTIGLFVFWWIQGYFNMAFSHVFDQSWEKVPQRRRLQFRLPRQHSGGFHPKGEKAAGSVKKAVTGNLFFHRCGRFGRML